MFEWLTIENDEKRAGMLLSGLDWKADSRSIKLNNVMAKYLWIKPAFSPSED